MIKKTSLKDQITAIILEKIHSGELKAGDRLKELSLANEFGTSQAPVREAFRNLEASGIIEHNVHKGASVKMITSDEMREFAEILQQWEVFYLIEYFSDIQERIFEIKPNVINYFDGEPLLPYHRYLHEMIIKTTGNNTLHTMWDNLSDRFQIGLYQRHPKTESEQIADYYLHWIDSMEHGNERRSTEIWKSIFQFLVQS